MNTLTKYVLKWPCLEQKGGLHVLVSLSSALTCHLLQLVMYHALKQTPFQNFDLWDHVPILCFFILVLPNS